MPRGRYVRQIDGSLMYMSDIGSNVFQEELQKKVKEIYSDSKKYIKDMYGNQKELPVAVFKERYYKEVKTNGNEEEIEEGLILEVLKNKTDFQINVDFDGTKFVLSNDRYNSHDFIIASGASFHNQFAKQGRTCVVILSDNASKNGEGIKIDDISSYNSIKEAFKVAGVEIIPDEEKKEEVEIMDNQVSYIDNEAPSEEEIEKMISLVDIDKFNKIIKARLARDGNSDRITEFDKKATEEYLKNWAINKYKYFKMFGDKLTLEQDVEVEKEETDYNDFITELKEKFPLYRAVIGGISVRAFLNNNIGIPSDCYLNENYFYDANVENNMKLTKFISLYGNKDLDMEISKFYQEKGKAHLVISIDPIDYLTVSINKSGWRSCHNFIDGEYRNAPLSYMNDSTSLVAYKTSGDVLYTLQRKKITWNSKSWRQMIYVSRNNSSLVFSRQYPHSSTQLSNAIRQIMEQCVSDYFKGQNKWTIYRKPDNHKTLVKKGDLALIYNDVEHGFEHVVVKAKDDENKEQQATIEIGSKVNGVISKTTLRNNNSIW